MRRSSRPLAFFTNGVSGTFKSDGTSLPAATPPGLYVLTMQVTAATAAGSPAVFDGLGFDPAHPYYLGTVSGGHSSAPHRCSAKPDSVHHRAQISPPTQPVLDDLSPTGAAPAQMPSLTYTLTGGDDGLEPESPDYDTALALFTSLEDIAIVAAPGSGIFDASQDIINSLITHVSQQRAYRIAVLETPPNQTRIRQRGRFAPRSTAVMRLCMCRG